MLERYLEIQMVCSVIKTKIGKERWEEGRGAKTSQRVGEPCIRTDTQTHKRTNTNTYTHAHTHTHVYTRTHAHTHIAWGYAELASSLLGPLKFAGRRESGNADEAVPQLR